ncbi:MAG: hypothetical protein AVDCRST_MAG59-3189, partial [uncultured Thermomicrobiales bacterium]
WAKSRPRPPGSPGGPSSARRASEPPLSCAGPPGPQRRP